MGNLFTSLELSEYLKVTEYICTWDSAP